MIEKMNAVFSRIATFLGFKKSQPKFYWPEQPMHFNPDIEHKAIEFMTIAEAIQSGIDVKADEIKHGMMPIFYRNGKPEFVMDIIADPGTQAYLFKENEK